MSALFSPLVLRKQTFRNRIFVSPMCQYSCAGDGVPTDWHLVHLGSRAVGGAALVVAEATAVSAVGRISDGDTGIWNESQEKAWTRITRFIREQGALAGIQLAHAGRKASSDLPWLGGKPVVSGPRAWQPIAPSAIAFDEGWPTPTEMRASDIESVSTEFVSSAERAERAGFDVVELHMAHGYLLHEFLSPLSNKRSDEYGGSFENRIRLPLEIARKVREKWPHDRALFVRISATDWKEGGWDLEQSIAFCSELKKIGVDLIDCSSGGNVAHVKIPVGPGYQVPFAASIREKCRIATGAVGLITDPQQAENIVEKGEADAVFLARELLRSPYWPLHAATGLNVAVEWPKQYGRART